jgi:actin-related protein
VFTTHELETYKWSECVCGGRLYSTADRERLVQTMFESFNVSGLYIAEAPVMVRQRTSTRSNPRSKRLLQGSLELKRLHVKVDEARSSFALTFNLRRYIVALYAVGKVGRRRRRL